MKITRLQFLTVLIFNLVDLPALGMAPNTPAAGLPPAFSAAALALIVDAEGVDQPGKWPGGSSGISLGHGYDLSAETADELRRDWAPYLSADQIARLVAAVGKSGQAAAAYAPRLHDITVTRAAADAVFAAATLPKYILCTKLAFGPAFNALPLDAQGALVSLVFNRGARMADLHPGDRAEMRAIRADLADGVQRGDLTDIALQLRKMKRLWVGKGLDGLLTRREAEARLVENAG